MPIEAGVSALIAGCVGVRCGLPLALALMQVICAGVETPPLL
jgi:hypothetical protein